MLASQFLQMVAFVGASLNEFRECDHTKNEIMYLYDAELNDCFAVRVNDCDEKAQDGLFNLAQCITTIAENHRCAAHSTPILRTDGSHDCDSNDVNAPECPKGSVCKGNVCCDEAIESEYLLEKYVTSCAPGVKASRENGQILFSANCTIDFCPDIATCTMGKHFAFCCPPF